VRYARYTNRVIERANVVDQFPGTGIGLAGAYQIVAEPDGSITVESELGAGTTVTVRLPVRAEATL